MEIISKKEELNAQTLAWKHSMAVLDSLLLKCAMDLEIADTLQQHGHPMTVPELASSLPKQITNTDVLRRVMRYCVHMKLFNVEESTTNDGEELYSPNPVTKFLLKDYDKGIIPLVRFLTQVNTLKPFFQIDQSLEGEAKKPAFELMHGLSHYEYASEHPEYNRVFNKAMECGARTVTPALIDGCRDMFGEIRSLVDVAGGTGMSSQAIAKAFPHIKCMVLDLPHVVATVPTNTGLEYIAGDMFSYIPKTDAVMLMRILHNWDEEDCLKILDKCKEAIPKEGGRVIIVDVVIGPHEEAEMGQVKLGMDMLMLTLFTGKERTEKEWRRLIKRAGFSRCKITHIMDMQSVIEAFP